MHIKPCTKVIQLTDLNINTLSQQFGWFLNSIQQNTCHGPSRPRFFATSVASRLQVLPVSNIAYVLKYPFGPYRVTDTTCNKTESLLLLWDALECSVDGVAASGVVWLVDAAVSIHCSHQVLHFSTNAEICIVSSCTPIHSTRFQVSYQRKYCAFHQHLHSGLWMGTWSSHHNYPPDPLASHKSPPGLVDVNCLLSHCPNSRLGNLGIVYPLQ